METKSILKSLMALALIGGPVLITSCSDDDDNNKDNTVVVSFENQKLNEQGFWMGEENGTGVSDEWGGTTYICSYAEKDLSFNTSYTKSSYGFSFMGFGISNRTATGFSATNLTIDQFNNVTGKAHSGKQFAVVYGQAATITVSNTKGVNVKGFFFTNSSYLVNSVENGDDYAKKFETGKDYFKVTVTADNGKSVDFYPADYRTGVTVVKDWKWLDLSSLGRVKVLTFTFDGTDKGSWGLNTPSYVCIDDLTYEVE